MQAERVTSHAVDGVAVLLIDNPPVNAMNAAVRAGLLKGVQASERDPAIRAVVIAAKGQTFVSGADLAEFDHGIDEPGYRACFRTIENCSKPVIASLHGTVLGAGVELALSCHYRIAQPSAKIGFPEITLGVVPRAGGTQRLPRLIGGKNALAMLLSGVPISAEQAIATGLIDEAIEGDPVDVGIAAAQTVLAAANPVLRTRDQTQRLQILDDVTVADLLSANGRMLKGRTTQHVIVEAVRGAITLDFEAGLDLEASLSNASLASIESRALRHAFFAERKSASVPGMARDVAAPVIKTVAVVGAGTMGSGIAIAFANAGYKVTLVDAAAEGLERGRGIIRSAYGADVARGRMTPDQGERAIQSIAGTLSLSEVKNADLVVEAVFENFALKQKVLAEIDASVGPATLIATNTSSLSVTELAKATRRPDKVIGLHFFSPAHIMRLLEIVRGKVTSPATLAAGLEVARRIKKVPVVSGDGFGFIGNRMMLDGAFREAEQMLLEGAGVDQVDRAIEAFGFAMGPNRVNDMAGVDIGTLVRQQLMLRATRADPYCVVSDSLTRLGRVGQKSDRGFYSYAENPRVGAVDPEVSALIERLAKDRSITRRKISDEDIVERFVLQLINVGADILKEGIAYRAGDIDVVWVHGFGFPRSLGGPMFYADTLGLDHVLKRVRHWRSEFGHYWEPSPLLEELAAANSSFAQFDSDNASRVK